MYGYILPDKPNLMVKDFTLFRAFYCGLCKATGKLFGQLPRAAVNYDAAFFALFFHSYYNRRPDFHDEGCILNPLKKKTIAKPTGILDRAAAFNVLLAYVKLTDDILDGEGIKRPARFAFNRAKKRADKQYPGVYSELSEGYSRLRELELNNVASPERAASAFADGFTRAVLVLFDERDNTRLADFLHPLARLIYLFDALDDLESDARQKNYNPFLMLAPFTAKSDFTAAQADYLNTLFGTTLESLYTAYTALSLVEGRDLLDNIILRGLRNKYLEILTAPKKLKKPKI